MVSGLVIMAAGALVFIPAASLPSYPLFLAALMVVAGGITALQVAANAYVSVLGKPETASSRLNFAQAFNSFGARQRDRQRLGRAKQPGYSRTCGVLDVPSRH